MADPEKITIIEGPPPTFEAVHESWLLGLIEGPTPAGVALCRLRWRSSSVASAPGARARPCASNTAPKTA